MFFIAATFCYCHKYALFPGQRKFKHAYQQNIFVTQLQYLVEDNKLRFSSLGFDVHCSYAQFYAQRLTKTQINILTHSEKGLSHGMQVNRKTVEMIFLLPLERKKRCLRYGWPSRAGGSDKDPRPRWRQTRPRQSHGAMPAENKDAPVESPRVLMREVRCFVVACSQVLKDSEDQVTDRAGDPDIETPWRVDF